MGAKEFASGELQNCKTDMDTYSYATKGDGDA